MVTLRSESSLSIQELRGGYTYAMYERLAGRSHHLSDVDRPAYGVHWQTFFSARCPLRAFFTSFIFFPPSRKVVVFSESRAVTVLAGHSST